MKEVLLMSTHNIHFTLQKHAYPNTLYIENFTTKKGKFSQIKNSDIFIFLFKT